MLLTFSDISGKNFVSPEGDVADYVLVQLLVLWFVTVKDQKRINKEWQVANQRDVKDIFVGRSMSSRMRQFLFEIKL